MAPFMFCDCRQTQIENTEERLVSLLEELLLLLKNSDSETASNTYATVGFSSHCSLAL